MHAPVGRQVLWPECASRPDAHSEGARHPLPHQSEGRAGRAAAAPSEIEHAQTAGPADRRYQTWIGFAERADAQDYFCGHGHSGRQEGRSGAPGTRGSAGRPRAGGTPRSVPVR
ncbi:hypothetical protein GZL_08979 [Streptomyces sp. 769]|nr:hypothetical protein GZL_08979 [Streptomyces sp. 769]